MGDGCGDTESILDIVNEMREQNEKLAEGQNQLGITVAILTENIQEHSRTNERLEKVLTKMEDRESERDLKNYERNEQLEKRVTSVEKAHLIFKTRVTTWYTAAVVVGSLALSIIKDLFC